MSDDNDGGPDAWRRQTHRIREALTETLVEIPAEYPALRMVFASRPHKQLHNLMHEYRQQAAPWRDRVNGDDDESGRWHETLQTVAVPRADAQVTLSRDKADLLATASDRELFAELYDRVERVDREITLANLDDHFIDSSVTLTVRGWVRNQGQSDRVLREPLYIPVRVARRARDQLDDCFNEFGWLPEADINEGDAGFKYEDILHEGPPMSPQEALEAGD